MSSSVKKIVSLAVAGAFAIGAAGALVPAADRVAYAHEQYADGSSNAYSHRMKEEQQRHDSAVRAIRHEKKYKKRMKEEQKRHDKAMEDIRHDYDSHARHSHH